MYQIKKSKDKFMDTQRWKSVAIRRDVVAMAEKIGAQTDRPTSNVFSYAVKRLHDDLASENLTETENISETPVSIAKLELLLEKVSKEVESFKAMKENLEKIENNFFSDEK